MAAQILDRAELDRALGAEFFLLFKHSHRCPISARAFSEYEAFAAAHEDVPTGWIDVIEQRPWSQWVAEKTGVAHASPQAIVVRGGTVAWSATHLAITKASLEGAAGDR